MGPFDRTENSKLLFATETACQLNATSPVGVIVSVSYARFYEKSRPTVNLSCGPRVLSTDSRSIPIGLDSLDSVLCDRDKGRRLAHPRAS